MRSFAMIVMLGAVAMVSIGGFAGTATAQDRDPPQITVTPSGPGGTGYYGAYGRDLPGVYMLSQNNLPTTPSINAGQVPLPGGDVISGRYTYNQPLPILDAWHGTIGPGFTF